MSSLQRQDEQAGVSPERKSRRNGRGLRRELPPTKRVRKEFDCFYVERTYFRMGLLFFFGCCQFRTRPWARVLHDTTKRGAILLLEQAGGSPTRTRWSNRSSPSLTRPIIDAMVTAKKPPTKYKSRTLAFLLLTQGEVFVLSAFFRSSVSHGKLFQQYRLFGKTQMTLSLQYSNESAAACFSETSRWDRSERLCLRSSEFPST